MKRLLISAAILFVASSAHAQQKKFAPVGFCTASTGLSSAIGLSSFTGTACAGLPTNTLAAYSYIVICSYTQGIVYRDDGTAPTGTAGSGGQAVNAGQCVGYNGNIGAIQFIQQTSGAVVGVSVYN